MVRAQTGTAPAGVRGAGRHGPSAARAIDRATRAGTPALLRLYVPVAAGDPWALLSRADPSAERLMAWRSADGARCFAAAGCVQEVVTAGPSRLDAAARACSKVRKQLVFLPPGAPTQAAAARPAASDVDPLPLLVGGFSFDPGPPGRGAPPDAPDWSGWGATRWWVPRVLMWRGPGGGVAVGTLRVEPGEDEASVSRRAEALARDMSEATAALPSRAPAPLAPEETWLAPARGWDEGAARRAWVAMVDQARRALVPGAGPRGGGAGGGGLEKVVLARAAPFEVRGRRADAAVTLAYQLRARAARSASFLVNLEGRGAFVGATPELLVEVRGRRVRTVALAGTAARRATPEADGRAARALAASAKDRYEHAVVVRGVEAALRPVCAHLERPPTPRVLSLGAVHHLETPISGELTRPLHVLEAAARLHPTPAVGGSPARTASAWIARHEGLERGWYAGAVGWISPRGDGVLAVALRAALLRDGRAWAFAGAGIVPSSDPAREWEETTSKLRTIAAAAGTPASSEGLA